MQAHRYPIPSHIPPELVVDFDWYGLGGVTDPYEHVAKLQEGPPIFFVPTSLRNNFGSWVLTRYDDIRKVMTDNEHFTSRNISGFEQVVPGTGLAFIPAEIDVPAHTAYRAFLNPLFSDQRAQAMEPVMRQGANIAIDRVIERGKCDFVADCTYYIMAYTWCELMGMPFEQADYWIRYPITFNTYTPAREKLMFELLDEAKRIYHDNKDKPGKGVINAFINNAEINGKKPTEMESCGFIVFMLIAGVDTVGATQTFCLKHLAEHPDLRRRLIERPETLGSTVEEFLRRYGTVASNRFVKRDVEIGGVLLKEGDNVVIPSMLGSLDSRQAKCPFEFDPERSPNRHMSFGTGNHICLGRFVAKRQVTITIQEWLRRIPDFWIAPETKFSGRVGDVFSLQSLPLEWQRV